jgi:hypothetical protein
MSPSDALMWNIERDPMLRSTILSVMILDRPPDPDRFRIAVARSLQRVPRLRQRVALDPLGVAPPRWELDPHFDLAYHVRRARPARAPCASCSSSPRRSACRPSTRSVRPGS